MLTDRQIYSSQTEDRKHLFVETDEPQKSTQTSLRVRLRLVETQSENNVSMFEKLFCNGLHKAIIALRTGKNSRKSLSVLMRVVS